MKKFRILSDNAPEEKERGINIILLTRIFSANRQLCSRGLFAGHADLLKNMVTGAAQMDGGYIGWLRLLNGPYASDSWAQSF